MNQVEAPKHSVSNWLKKPWLVVVDILVVLGFLFADRHHLVPLSNTPFLFVLAWASLRLRGSNWRSLGFERPTSWVRAIGIGVAVGILMELLATYGIEPLLQKIIGRPPDLSNFKSMVGNIKFLLVILIFNWSVAAFGEEMVWRGYLMNRLADLGKRSRSGWAFSLILASLLFGCAHGESQGLTGILMESWNGLLLGLLYLAAGRQLSYPIIAHGVSNTLAFVLIFLGRYPGA